MARLEAERRDDEATPLYEVIADTKRDIAVRFQGSELSRMIT
jgi:hypothetical protein